MAMTTMNIALWAALAAAVSSALTYFIMKARTAALLGEKDSEIAGKDMEIARMEAEIRIKAAEAQNQEGNMEALQKAHEKDLLTIKAEMMIQTEKILKEREEQLSKKAEETFKTISGNIGKELKDMKQAFDANKQTQTENSSSLKTQLEEAVKHLREQAGSIGTKADHLADALKGRNKMQGCWGETILNNIFIQEGLIEGRDYDKEETMKDEMGIAILNEDSGKRMRPDFILHFPDNTDIIVDSKVSLSALADWVEAQDEKRREDAARRNLQSVKEQIKNLASKSYYDKSAGEKDPRVCSDVHSELRGSPTCKTTRAGNSKRRFQAECADNYGRDHYAFPAHDTQRLDKCRAGAESGENNQGGANHGRAGCGFLRCQCDCGQETAGCSGGL